MKSRICIYLMGIILMFLSGSCEKVEIPDVPEFDKTVILSFEAYDLDKHNIVSGEPVISSDKGEVVVNIKKDVDLSKVFATCGVSSGATIYPPMGTYQDWSSKTKKFVVTSASGERQQNWVIIFK